MSPTNATTLPLFPIPNGIFLPEMVVTVATELLGLMGGGRLVGLLDGIEDPGALADTLGWWPELAEDRRLELFETTDVEDRIRKALAWATEALAEAKVSHSVSSEVRTGFEKDQHEAILRRQLSAIRKELGESDDDELAGYRSRLAEESLPPAVVAAVEKELDRLERMGDQTMEASVDRTWIETVFELRWSARTTDTLDLDAAQASSMPITPGSTG